MQRWEYEIAAILSLPVVMIVEHDPGIRELLAHALRLDGGFFSMEVGSEAEALQRIRHMAAAGYLPSSILLSLVAQDCRNQVHDFLDGLHDVARLNEAPPTIIAMSTGRRNLPSGVDYLITKPFSFPTLLSILRKTVLGHHSAS